MTTREIAKALLKRDRVYRDNLESLKNNKGVSPSVRHNAECWLFNSALHRSQRNGTFNQISAQG